MASTLQDESNGGKKQGCADNLMELLTRKVDISEYKDEM